MSDEKQHRTNVTKTELTDDPEDQGSQRWAEQRGQDQDASTEQAPQAEQQPAEDEQ